MLRLQVLQKKAANGIEGQYPIKFDVERALEGEHLRDLGRVAQRERAEQVARRDDGAGRELVLDRAALGRLERHDHLHRLDLDEGLARLDLGAVVDVTDLETLRQRFDELDKDKNGTLDVEELTRMFQAFGKEISPGTLANLVRLADDDNSGTISFEEFAAVIGHLKPKD